MTIFFQYLLRLSISFAVMYLFYAIVLRRLTFYNHNRWYLLGYSVLCFFIPLINISSFSSAPQQSEATIMNTTVVHMIPNITLSASPEMQMPRVFDAGQIIMWIFFIGIAIMLLRLLFQLFSYKKLTRSAEIISDEDDVKLYQVDKEIVPFSFGNSIFINQNLHNENALQEILRHEFVHIKQRHTIDILWSELILILNWYNHFVWLIRKSIRENLEFIADDKVVQSGINKQQYQYLLLRVMGNNNFSIANNFNFSSLKKRITMMNKIKTAKIHLLKFLFLIPLLGILLASFRDVIKTSRNADTMTISGIVVDENLQPLSNVSVEDYINHIKITTDKSGYYSFKIKPDTSNKLKILLGFKKNGFGDLATTSYAMSSKNDNGFIVLNIGLKAWHSDNKNSAFPFAAWSKTYEHSINNNEMWQQLNRSVNNFKEDDDEDKIETSENSQGQHSPAQDSIPVISYKEFLKNNPSVSSLGWKTDTVIVLLKNDKIEKYKLNDKEEILRAEKKYGKFPSPPPPPPLRKGINQNTGKILTQVQVEPKFPGGNEAWRKYLHDNLKEIVPVDNHAPAGQYIITVSFLVHKDGSLSEVKAIDAPKSDYGTAAEAVRLIESGPKWIPALIDGKPVTYRQKQKIVFEVAK